MNSKNSIFAIGLALAAALSACGNDSAKSAGVTPVAQGEKIGQSKTDQGKTDQDKTDQGKQDQVPGKDDGKQDTPKKDDTVVVPPKKDDAVVVPPKKGGVVVVPPKKDDVVVVPPKTGGIKGKKSYKLALEGQWTYKGETCLPSGKTLDVALVKDASLVWGQGTWQQQQDQGQGQGQGQQIVVGTPKVIIIHVQSQISKTIISSQQNNALESINLAGQQDLVLQDDEFVETQNQGKGKIILPSQQQQGGVWQDSIIDQNQLFITDTTQQTDQNGCESGKVIQKFQK